MRKKYVEGTFVIWAVNAPAPNYVSYTLTYIYDDTGICSLGTFFMSFRNCYFVLFIHTETNKTITVHFLNMFSSSCVCAMMSSQEHIKCQLTFYRSIRDIELYINSTELTTGQPSS